MRKNIEISDEKISEFLEQFYGYFESGYSFEEFLKVYLEKIVLASTEEGQVIMDPFCGSGTTGVEAVRFGRKFIGIDISEEYLEISKRRLEKVANDK